MARPSSSLSDWGLVLSCEHGGNRVPARWSAQFAGTRARTLLDSHRGWDPGALDLARLLSRRLGAPLIACTTTRLLADANRPPGHPRLFSSFTRELSASERCAILRTAHEPHWQRVERAARAELTRHRRVLHLSVHSFTPVLAGVPRNCELGLLFDPRRSRERALCLRWQAQIDRCVALDAARVRRNYPYRGVSAALTTSLRRRFAPGDYLGIELELNQGHWRRLDPRGRKRLATALAHTLRAALASARAQTASRWRVRRGERSSASE